MVLRSYSILLFLIIISIIFIIFHLRLPIAFLFFSVQIDHPLVFNTANSVIFNPISFFLKIAIILYILFRAHQDHPFVFNIILFSVRKSVFVLFSLNCFPGLCP